MNPATFLAACVLDATVGDPRWLPHPVRLMGQIITWYERHVRRVVIRPSGEWLAGAALAVILPTIAYGVGWLVIGLTMRAHQGVGTVVEVVLALTTLAARDLADHVSRVRTALESDSLDQGRKAVSQIVGRDTEQLSHEDVVRATVETVAESTSDGVIAPLLYLVLGGVPLALAYKAINTLDSMIGHRDPPYRYFGWASARLDDLANWVPARITAFLIIVCAPIACREAAAIRHAWAVLWRDGGRHASPNSGRPEAAMAGALRVQLGGTSYYGGVREYRPVLGNAHRPLDIRRINESVRIMWSVVSIAALVGFVILL